MSYTIAFACAVVVLASFFYFAWLCGRAYEWEQQAKVDKTEPLSDEAATAWSEFMASREFTVYPVKGDEKDAA